MVEHHLDEWFKGPCVTVRCISIIFEAGVCFLCLGNRKMAGTFGFRFRGGPGATFFGHPKSGFIWKQLPPPCCSISIPMRSKSCTWGTLVVKLVPHQPWLPRLPPVYLQKWLVIISPRQQWLEGSENYHEIDHLEQSDPGWMIPSAFAPITKALKELPRDRKKQKNIKYSRNITFDKAVNIVH